MTPLGKFEVILCPFGLVQSPAYFKQMIYEVLRGLEFTFGYMDDISVFRLNVGTQKFLDCI